MKSFFIEQFHFIKQSVREPFAVEKNSQQENYISRLLEDINYLKQENITKSSIIMQPLIQSGNTNNYDNNNSYSKSNNNDENKNSGIKNDDINIHIPNDDSNITMRRRKNKPPKDKSTCINNTDKNSNKINGKNDNNKNNIKNKCNKSSESSRSGSNDIIDTSTYNQKQKVFILGDSMVK